MKYSIRFFLIVVATTFAIIPTLASAEKIPMTAWIHDPVIASVDVSPNGDKIVALTLSNVNDPADITIWNTNDLSAEPLRFKPKRTKALSVDWLSDDRLFVIGRQKYDYRIGSRTIRWFKDYAYIVDSEGKRFRELFRNKENEVVGVSLFDTLPLQPDKILV